MPLGGHARFAGLAAKASLAMPPEGHAGFAGVAVYAMLTR